MALPEYLSRVLTITPESYGHHQLLLVVPISLIFIILSILSGGVIINKKQKEWRRRIKLVNKFPGLKSYPFVGSIPHMIDLIETPCRDMLPWTIKMVERFGPIYKFWMLGQPKMFICCPEAAIKLLQGECIPARPIEVMKTAEAIGGEGLVAVKIGDHASRRKMWYQGLTKRHIDSNAPVFRQEAIRLCSALKTYAENEINFDFMNHAIFSTFRTIAYSAFGSEYMESLPEDVGKNHIRDLHTLSYNLVKRMFYPWLENDWLFYNFTRDGRETRRCVQSANELTRKAVEHRKRLRQQEINRKKEILPCFIDHLLDQEEKSLLTERQVLDELNTFIVAGYDTSGLTICYVIYMLALNSHQQDKVVEELLEIFGENPNEFTEINPGHLREMRYLELCIKETLRFYPVLPFLFRRSINNAALPDGRIIPEGVDVYINIIHIHQDPTYFPDPESFIPDRHLVPIPAFIPFGLGSRNCIGQVYAIQEMKMILAHLLMEYKWETTEKNGFTTSAHPLLYPENGLRFTISKRYGTKN